LREQGRFAEALEAVRCGHELGSKLPGWPIPSADWVREGERLVELDRRLAALLRGAAEPVSAAERIEFAHLCGHYKRLHVTASCLYADAFAADPQLADDLAGASRYDAACSAALAAAGQAEDAKNLPDKVIVMLRRHALRWLRADLALRVKMAEGGDAAAKQSAREKMLHWQQDADLASVRDKAALDKLPDDEREAWRALWAEVAGLLKKVEEK
jgi:hypothetical protein